jgi:hypothetical protein
MTSSERPPQPSPPVPSDDEVPLFRTWPRIHGAVIAVALAVMALLALFSRWPF